MRLSLGTAAVLGLAQARQTDPPTTAYLLLGGRCAANCGFCPQAREAHGRADQLSRVTWPAFAGEEVLAALTEAPFRRLCLQVVDSPGWRERLLAFLSALKGVAHPPLSLSARPANAAEVGEWLELGVQRVGLPVDAATPEVFRRVKGGDFHRALDLLGEAASAFPGRVSTHLIVGLGETEREAAETLLLLYRLGLTVGLFAFTPVRGTALEGHAPPDPGVYRRLQVARWLLATRRVEPEGRPFAFDAEGRLAGFGLAPAELREALAGGEAFRTSGCPDCNRPYYNERPGGVTYNYPRPLAAAEVAQALAETGWREILAAPRRATANAAEAGPAAADAAGEEWRLLETGYARGVWNLAVDEALMEAVGRGESPPALRFYGWDPPALSLGYFQDRDREVDLRGCAAQGFDCVRRPTGGRAVLHAEEVTYAVVVPEGHSRLAGSVSETYRAISEGLAAGLRQLGVPAEVAPAERRAGERSAACFDAPSFYELVVEGRKLVGSAQVRRGGAILQHGSILCRFDPEQLLRCLAVPAGRGGERLRQTLSGHVASLQEVLGRAPGFAEVVRAVAAGMAETFGVRLVPGGLSAAERRRAAELAREKYASEAWNGRRPGQAG
jgi:biotin synthase